MILLGLDARPSSTLALFADEHGRILSRGTHPTLDAAAAATHDGQRPASVGIVVREGRIGSGVAVNPGAAIALAEEWIGAARGARHVAGLTLESSIHAGFVIDGRLFGGTLEPTRMEVSRRVSPAASPQVSVVPTSLGEASAAIGAARTALPASQPG